MTLRTANLERGVVLFSYLLITCISHQHFGEGKYTRKTWMTIIYCPWVPRGKKWEPYTGHSGSPIAFLLQTNQVELQADACVHSSPQWLLQRSPQGSCCFLGRVSSGESWKGWSDWHPNAMAVKPPLKWSRTCFTNREDWQGEGGSPLDCQSEHISDFCLYMERTKFSV